MKRKVIGLVGANGVPASYGGWDQLLEHFTLLNDNTYEFKVFCTFKTNNKQGSVYNYASIEVVHLDANGWQSIPYDIISLIRAYRMCDGVIMLGTSGAIILPLMRLLGQKVLLNIDGAEWKRGKWNFIIKQYLKFVERCGVWGSKALICDNEVISEYVEKTYAIHPLTIAYGGDHVKCIPDSGRLSTLGLQAKNYAFKVCRIVPENNLDMILEAFSNCEVSFVLVGNFNASEYGKRIRETYGFCNNITLLDPIYDQDELNILRSNAGLYVHGHSVGGTNPSLVEAMHLGLNIVSFDVSYNRSTTQGHAHYFSDAKQLINILEKFSDGYLVNNGAMCKSVAEQNYKWSKIMEQYLEALNDMV